MRGLRRSLSRKRSGPEPGAASAARGRRAEGHGYFVWRCKGASAPAENSCARLLQAHFTSGRIAFEKARVRVPRAIRRQLGLTRDDAKTSSPSGPIEKPDDMFWRKLFAEMVTQLIETDDA